MAAEPRAENREEAIAIRCVRDSLNAVGATRRGEAGHRGDCRVISILVLKNPIRSRRADAA
jgi:hypothetical protein